MQSIVAAALRRGVPVTRVAGEDSLLRLGWGRCQQRILASATSRTGHIAVEIASDTGLAMALLAEAGVPVPRGEVVATAEQAVAAARRLGGAVVVKPLDAGGGDRVSTGLRTPDEVRAAFDRAWRCRSRARVEQHLEGANHRVLVVDGRFVAAARRCAPAVVGDGRRNVLELVRAEARTAIPIDATTHEVLARQGLSLDSIAPAGMAVVLRGDANLATGGTAEDVTDRTHPEVAAACVRAARKIGLDVCGLDVVCRDISRPLGEQGGGIVEVVAEPDIGMHERPAAGDAILRMLFPRGDGRIPLVCVAGGDGSEAIALLVAQGLQAGGACTGVATTGGIRIGAQAIRSGDCTDGESARTVLMGPEVDAAVLEIGGGGDPSRDLGFDRCEVAVIMGVRDDRAEGVVALAATRAVVLNADEPRCVALADRVAHGVRVILVSMHDANPVVQAHLEAGGSAACIHGGLVVLGAEPHRFPLLEASRIGVDIGDALAATAALWAVGLDRRAIVDALTVPAAEEIADLCASGAHTPAKPPLERRQAARPA